MIDIELIRNDPELVRTSAKNRGYDIDVDEILHADEKRRAAIRSVEEMRREHNQLSDAIATMAADERANAIASSKELKDRIGHKEFELKVIEEDLAKQLRSVPNISLPGVPVGADESANVVIREVGEKPSFSFEPMDYVEMAESLDLIDTARAAKVSGARFGYIKREAALLEFALIQLAFETVTNERTLAEIIEEGGFALPATPFIPVIPPVLVKPAAMGTMGYVERGGDEIYRIEKDDLMLVGTSEQSIGPMHMDETFTEDQLPRRYIGFSTCFRREAGSYGKDTRGILRVHQFNKLEMVSFVLPEQSRDEHLFLLAIEEHLMRLLDLPYHVLNICTGDLGDPAAAKFDIEAWFPAQNEKKGTARRTLHQIRLIFRPAV